MIPSWLKRQPRDVTHTAVAHVIEHKLVHSVFQPVVDLSTGSVLAYEALARSDSPHFKGPIELFSAAVQYNKVGELGRLCRRLAVDGCPDFPLFVNVHPSEFGQPWLVRPDDALWQTDQPVYLEITESVPISHYEFCHSVLRELRGRGAKLVVDDLGAGYSNLKYIADLSPEVVKLDRELIIALHTQPRAQLLVKSLVDLCSQLGAKVVAEGIETAEELAAVIDTGVHFGQGYFLARPNAPPPVVSWQPARAPAVL